MAKFDHGGGCACGLQKVCTCSAVPLPSQITGRRADIIIMDDLPAPAKQPTLPTDAKSRKEMPIARGVLDYFPDALGEVARLSKIGNDQHNPGQEMHWAKEKSTDHADCIIRHLIDRGTVDTDGVRHATKVAWRALALLQTEIDKERGVQ